MLVHATTLPAGAAPVTLDAMRIAVAADERTGIAEAVLDELRRRGHDPAPHGALRDSERDDWAWVSEAAARDVAEGRADQAIVCVLALSLRSTSAAEPAEIESRR